MEAEFSGFFFVRFFFRQIVVSQIVSFFFAKKKATFTVLVITHTYALPPGSSDSASKHRARSASLMGRVDGSDGDQKCPLNFFILCGFIDKI